MSEADARLLSGYLEILQRVAVSGLNRDEQLAYRTKLHNAATVKPLLQYVDA